MVERLPSEYRGWEGGSQSRGERGKTLYAGLKVGMTDRNMGRRKGRCRQTD